MVEGRKTLPAKFYTCPDYFKREMDEFFQNGWVCVGRTDEIPNTGDYVLKNLGKESLIVTRANDGSIRCHYNVCRHRGTQICEEHKGTFKGSIQCRYHAWTWSLEGKMVGAPHMGEVEGFAFENYPLHHAACDVWEGNIFVNLAKSPTPLSQHIGKLQETFAPWRIGELRLAKRTHYHVKANWKYIIQNFSECLHCPSIHPALSKLSSYLSGDNEEPNADYLGGHMTLKDGIQSMTMSGESTHAVLPELTGELRRYVYYYAVLPNLLISPHPDFVMTHTLWPKSPGETEIICEFHFHPDEMKKPGFSCNDVAEFWDVTNRQDWRVSELSQLGVESKAYQPGPYSKREKLLWSFDDIVLDRMGHSEMPTRNL